jgi:hypothetical protein
VIGRWLPFAVAAVATALLAGGIGVAADRLVTPHGQAVPQLRTVPAATLARVGITLGPPSQPVYCGLAAAAVQNGWLRSGSVGCAISQPAAEAAARQGGRSRVIESVLALVTSSRGAAVLRDHLTWLVVTQSTVNACQPAAGYSVCFGPRGGWNQLVLVDARSGGVMSSQRLTPAGWGGVPFPRGFPAGGTVSSG